MGFLSKMAALTFTDRSYGIFTVFSVHVVRVHWNPVPHDQSGGINALVMEPGNRLICRASFIYNKLYYIHSYFFLTKLARSFYVDPSQ